MLLSLVNMGTIRRKDDPVKKTQTDPITLKAKTEELKEGPKGAPTPLWNLYPKREFLTDPPTQSVADGLGQTAGDRIPNPGDPIPEDLTGMEDAENWALQDRKEVPSGPSEEGEDWWLEEQLLEDENEVKE